MAAQVSSPSPGYLIPNSPLPPGVKKRNYSDFVANGVDDVIGQFPKMFYQEKTYSVG